MMHVRFLLQTLAGNTRLLFRQHYKDNPKISIEGAKMWLRSNCTPRDFRQSLQTEMNTLKMKYNEPVQVFLSRANTLRSKLSRHGIDTDDFHFRNHIEVAMKRIPTANAMLRDVLRETGAMEYSVSKFQERVLVVTHAHSTTATAGEQRDRKQLNAIFQQHLADRNWNALSNMSMELTKKKKMRK
eukprot:SAG31_NODE_4939_length_2847_cov_140.287118_3_plen_185_part_00